MRWRGGIQKQLLLHLSSCHPRVALTPWHIPVHLGTCPPPGGAAPPQMAAPSGDGCREERLGRVSLGCWSPEPLASGLGFSSLRALRRFGVLEQRGSKPQFRHFDLAVWPGEGTELPRASVFSSVKGGEPHSSLSDAREGGYAPERRIFQHRAGDPVHRLPATWHPGGSVRPLSSPA